MAELLRYGYTGNKREDFLISVKNRKILRDTEEELKRRHVLKASQQEVANLMQYLHTKPRTTEERRRAVQEILLQKCRAKERGAYNLYEVSKRGVDMARMPAHFRHARGRVGIDPEGLRLLAEHPAEITPQHALFLCSSTTAAEDYWGLYLKSKKSFIEHFISNTVPDTPPVPLDWTSFYLAETCVLLAPLVKNGIRYLSREEKVSTAGLLAN